jgi:hypothetical protein
MKYVVPIYGEARALVTQHECGFQEVLADCEKADTVYVATYNCVGWACASLLDPLRKLSGSTQVRIVTNIPGRWERYRGNAEEKARRSIQAHLKAIAPSGFASPVSAFVNFANHSKIIATEHIAYIGSSNVSLASKDNLECGVLVLDQACVDSIIHTFFPVLEQGAIPYFGKEIDTARVTLQLHAKDAGILRTRLHEAFYGGGPTGMEAVDEGFLSGLRSMLWDIESTIVEWQKGGGISALVKEFDLSVLRSMRELAEQNGPLDSLAQYDSRGVAMELYEGGCVGSDNLNEPMNEAMAEAAEIEDERWHAAEADVAQIEEYLEELGKALVAVDEKAEELDRKQQTIDNT